jgi:hypothetical protein
MEHPEPDVLIELEEGSSVKRILIKDPGLLIGVVLGPKVTVYGNADLPSSVPALKGGLLIGTGEYKTK